MAESELTEASSVSRASKMDAAEQAKVEADAMAIIERSVSSLNVMRSRRTSGGERASDGDVLSRTSDDPGSFRIDRYLRIYDAHVQHSEERGCSAAYLR